MRRVTGRLGESEVKVDKLTAFSSTKACIRVTPAKAPTKKLYVEPKRFNGYRSDYQRDVLRVDILFLCKRRVVH